MVQSPSCEANWFAASQEIPLISRNPKVHYREEKTIQALNRRSDKIQESEDKNTP